MSIATFYTAMPAVVVSGSANTFYSWQVVTKSTQAHSNPEYELPVPPHRRTTYGSQAFAVAGPSTWNLLTTRLRDPSFSTSVFGHLHKTFIFSDY